MRWALLSVWDKKGIVELARTLERQGFRILASGGTAKMLGEGGVEIQPIEDYTGFPEMMDGRVKTLHPRIHGGLLGRRGVDDAVMERHGIRRIELLAVNLYPFEAMSEQGLTLEELVEFIDIGGPAMIRAAAKNYRDVAVLVDPSDYTMAMEALDRGGFTLEERFLLAKKAFARTAGYDAAISNYLHSLESEFPQDLFLHYRNGRPLRYGENPHQKGAVYGEKGIAGAVPFQGKEMSYNNYLDLDAGVRLLREFGECCTAVIKHNNPSGLAVAEDPLSSYIAARDADPVSAYGSIVAFNRGIDAAVARELCRTFVEVVIAPSFTQEAFVEFGKKPNIRILQLPPASPMIEVRSIDGGILAQKTPPHQEEWKVVTDRSPDQEEERALKIAWRVCKHTKSNAIVIAGRDRTYGIGAGQTSRVDAAKIAIQKSLVPLKDAAVASDAFLPFPDTLELVAEAGATALIQPGGSIRDDLVIQAADRLGVAMVFTGTRYFRH
ncbi:MAG: bifunctional phosphoribosylaminoimidazolecarboxamide formyltransferase/IMP cyclohydrolase [Methanomicrobiales archaeon]|nr:bifunctional phosphoribosylaminoimidazolecarboxamide formyltransferase/IMP cyclohydrolase [Methanomicrobiales archaeon]